MLDLFKPSVHYKQQWSGAVAIVSPGHIPTVDFYISSRLHDVPPSKVYRFESLAFDAEATNLPVGTFVVIVRHTSAAWLRFIQENKQHWSGVAYLMDDDIPGAITCRDIPVDYALWTSGRYWLARKALAKVCDRVWLSTDALRARYHHVQSQLVSPQSVGHSREAAPIGNKRWAYHGTRIHRREIKWLLPIVKAVQQIMPEAEFEVFGDAAIARLFSEIPRVKVMAPVPWADYLHYCDASNIAVALAPMLPGHFNDVRSYTKAFDIARCGAVGVFSKSEAYAALQTGLGDFGATVLPNDQAQWVQEVINLLQDDDLRLRQYQQLVSWIESHSTDKSFSALILNGLVSTAATGVK